MAENSKHGFASLPLGVVKKKRRKLLGRGVGGWEHSPAGNLGRFGSSEINAVPAVLWRHSLKTLNIFTIILVGMGEDP